MDPACINFRKQLLQWDLGKCVQREDLDESGEVGGDCQLLPSDSDRQVSTNRRPELNADRVGRSAVEGTYPQALFDPAKEKFDLPTLAIELGDRCRGKRPLVRPECDAPRFLYIENTHTPHQIWPVARHVPAVETNRLIGSKTRGAVYRARGGYVIPHIRSLADNEEGPCVGDSTQAPKIHVATAHQIIAAGLDRQIVQPSDVDVSCGSDC